MPAPGLSLAGFMDQQQAIHHLRDFCIGDDSDDAALTAQWREAAARLGPPVTNAGLPEVLPIPDAYQDHIAQVSRIPKVASMLSATTGLGFAMVEIDPLLAFQFSVSNPASTQVCGNLSSPPTMEELLNVCLPLTQPTEKSRMVRGAQSILFKSPSLNVRVESAGILGPGVIGVKFGIDLALVRVVRHNGKTYLRNGFHRAVGLRFAGATHMPCLFRDAMDIETVGMRTDGTTFGPAMMRSQNPPTVGHFTSGRAYPVTLRSMSKVILVSWAEYAVAEDV